MARKAPPPHTKHSAPKRRSGRKQTRPLPQKAAFLGALAGLGSLIGSLFG